MRLGGIVAALALVAVGCGEDDKDDSAEQAQVRAERSEAADLTPVPPTPTPEPPESVPTLEESLGEPSGAGSVVEPGLYRSAGPRVSAEYALTPHVSVLLTPTLVTFGPPGFDPFSDPSVSVFRLEGVPTAENVSAFNPSPSPPVTPIADGEELTAFFTDAPGVTLLDSGGDETVTWWDITTTGDGYPQQCAWGGKCLNIVAAEGHGYFVIGEEWTVRIWRLDESNTGSAHVWLQAPSDEFEGGLEWGQAIVDGITID